MAVTLVLTRHGGTPLSRPEQHLGQRLDPGLSAEGRDAATALGARLSGVGFDAVYSSPLARAVETTRRIVGDAPIRTDRRLLEMDYGAWEGHTYAQISEIDEDAREAWESDPADRKTPGGESGNDVAARVRSFLEEAVGDARVPRAGSAPGAAPVDRGTAADVADRRILVVAHSTTNRVLLSVVLGTPLGDYRRTYLQTSCNLTVLRFDGSWNEPAMLLVANDVAHLRGMRGATWDPGA